MTKVKKKMMGADANNSAPSTEYSVYIFQGQEEDRKTHSLPWQRKHTTTSKQGALKRAGALYRSNQYKRVEVKKKYFNPANDTKIHTTLKVFDRAERQEKSKLILAVTSLVIFTLFVAVSLFLAL